MSKKYLFNLALGCALISTIFLSMVGFSKDCNEMYDNIIRIRILANSNSEVDQELKIKVRDAILNGSNQIYSNIDSYEDALVATTENIEFLLSLAKNAVYENGYNYEVSLELKDEYFNTREYNDFTLPAGNYKTAVFTLGKGKGENWWCVIYPRVCVGVCTGKLEDTLSKETANTAYNPKKYVVKFKTVEIFEGLKKYLKF